ncbi:hypothetical protein MBLNU13_g09393t1 [Cladosporium sp. NU13]
MAEQDLYFKQYNECEELYTQEKYTECTKLALYNLTDSTMPRYFLIKTLLLLVGAENDDWHKAEAYRVRAEKEYRATKQHLSKPPTSAEETSMQELRKWLDDTLEYQANDAPPMSLEYAHYPAREGWLMDLLYEREVRKDIDEAESNEAIEEVTEELEEMELDDDKIPLEDDEAVRAADAEVLGEDVNITQMVREIQSEDQTASSDEAMKGQYEQEASSEAAEDQQDQPEESGGVRAKVSDSMKGNKLERKSSTKTLRRQPSTLSQKKRAPWRN